MSKGASDALAGFPRPIVINLLFEIPGGGLLTRFCYVASGNRDRASWPVVAAGIIRFWRMMASAIVYYRCPFCCVPYPVHQDHGEERGSNASVCHVGRLPTAAAAIVSESDCAPDVLYSSQARQRQRDAPSRPRNPLGDIRRAWLRGPVLTPTP